jgi:hypothetical protein|tara:strand:+ start:1239 stop:1463 length:225 start_codon:yes stop_codon:yes gene_type:complete
MVVFGFYLDMFGQEVLEYLEEDPKSNGGTITTKNLSPKGITDILINEIVPNADYSYLLEICERKNPRINYHLGT